MPAPDALAAVLRSGLTVLVVEDEARYRQWLLGVLEDMDCRSVGAATAMEALDVVDEAAPDAVILDLHLPVMGGMAFLERFRRRHPDAPVIILTGVGDLPTAQEAIRHGVTEFLTKPCHLGEIEAAIDRARRRVARGHGRDDEPGTSAGPVEAPRTIAEVERDAIIAALRAHGGNRSAAAAELGISRRTLYNRMEQYRREGRDVSA